MLSGCGDASVVPHMTKTEPSNLGVLNLSVDIAFSCQVSKPHLPAFSRAKS